MKYVKFKVGIESSVPFMRIARACDLSQAETWLHLYKVASWFAIHGEYGKMKVDASVIDLYLKCDGFAAAMQEVGWLKNADGVLLLGSFCNASATRKSLGKKIRQRILASGHCAACGGNGPLEIDHRVPISRGGSCTEENLQALCETCNASKGAKTMEEFMAWREQHA